MIRLYFSLDPGNHGIFGCVYYVFACCLCNATGCATGSRLKLSKAIRYTSCISVMLLLSV